MTRHPRRGRGRPPGGGSSREDILTAARQEFAERGFGPATVRGIAGRAGVDPAMINHHFGSKHGLFAATLRLPFDPAEAMGQVIGGPRDQLGERLVDRFLLVWDTVAGELASSVVRTAMSQDETMAQLREFVIASVIMPLFADGEFGPDERAWRASLVASTMLGLIMARYVIGFEPLASAPHAQVVGAVAPTLQRYLTGALEPGATI